MTALTPANGTSISRFDLNSRNADEGLAMGGLLEMATTLVEDVQTYGEDHTYEMEEGYVPPAPRFM